MSHVVNWIAPQKRADGTGEAAHYAILIDGEKVAQTSAATTSVDLAVQPFYKTLAPGVHTLRVVAIDKYNQSSPPSAGALVTIAPPPAPAAPTGVTVA